MRRHQIDPGFLQLLAIWQALVGTSAPFRGDFRVSTAPFERILSRMEAAAGQHDPMRRPPDDRGDRAIWLQQLRRSMPAA
jgi:hypothetical protein